MYAPRKGFPQKLREVWWPGVCLSGMFTHSPPPYLHRDTIVCSCLPQAFFHFFFLSFLFLKTPNIYFLFFPPLQSVHLHANHPNFRLVNTTSLKVARRGAGQEHPNGDAALDLNSAAAPRCCQQTELVREQTSPHARSRDDSHPAPFARSFCNPLPAFCTGRDVRTGAGRRIWGGVGERGQD